MWKYTTEELPTPGTQVWVRLFPDSGVPTKASLDGGSWYWYLAGTGIPLTTFEVIRWKYQ